MLGLFKPNWVPISMDYVYFGQEMVAHSQWAMERWNDALAAVADDYHPGDEVETKSRAFLSDPEALREELLPAGGAQLTTAVIMRARAAQRRRIPKNPPQELARLAQALNAWLYAYWQKAEHRVHVLKEALTHADRWQDYDLSAFDGAEAQAMLEVTDALLDVKAYLHLSGEVWLAILFQAMNEHRKFRGLSPMTESTFNANVTSGLAGGTPRYFSP